MYESFYGLTEKPFTLLPDPEYLYLSPKHQRALTLLQYGLMNQAGFSVICGDTGAGKTTLIRRLLGELEDNTTVGMITNTHQSFGELLNWVLMAFGLDGEGKSKSQMHHMFVNFLVEQYAQNKHTVLIVDEAQNMKADTLEELRMLSNINADKDQVLQVILAGQPALRETLRRPELMQFAQRIAVDYYLEALNEQETHDYIQHRLQVAGAEQTIFTDDACSAIYQYSGGTPRLINLLCDTALVYGYAEQSKTIDATLVHDVVREQHSNSIIPTFKTSQPHATDNLPPVQPETSQQTSTAVEPAQRQPVQDTPELASNAEVHSEVQADTRAEALAEAAPISEQPTEQAAEPARTAPPANSEADEPIADLARRAQQAVNEGGSVENTAQSTSADPLSDQGRSESTNKVSDVATDTTYHAASSMDQHHNRHDDTAPHASSHRHREEHYPIVHIEDSPRKGLNLVLIGLVIGMFIASMMMMAFAWMTLGDRDGSAGAAIQTEKSQPAVTEVERQELEALKKERDAALAVSRALERERDAALTAARAQEQMRAAEVRAAEILAEQERKTEARLNEARTRAREAEIAEARARERERVMQLRAQQRAAELEAQLEAQLEAERLEALRAEQARQELVAQEAALRTEQQRKQQTEQNPSAEAQNTPDTGSSQPTRPRETDKQAKQTTQEEDQSSFSANPCNTPSAKFLSTCKR